nr:uncharacterized protein LOC109172155 [Ipomoea batatas]
MFYFISSSFRIDATAVDFVSNGVLDQNPPKSKKHQHPFLRNLNTNSNSTEVKKQSSNLNDESQDQWDGFTGHILKMHFWGVCKATTEAEFEARMEELKGCNVKAFDWLKARDPKHYCRAFFSTFPKSDLLLNNLCESWNSCILNFRDKPIQTMCEKLRLYLMTRMQRNRDRMMSYPFKVCPRILKLIEEGKEKSARFSAYKSVDEIYQVDDDNFKAYKVDLSSRQCSCKRWDLSGIPCTHAIAAIRKKGDIPENHVHACYSVEHYLRAYGPAILPIRAQELWHKTGMPSPLPPKYKPQPGRPKKKRKIDPAVEKPDLKKATKKGELKKCKLCGMRGHNRTTCKGKSQQDSMSSQPAQLETNDIPTVADFISDTIDNEPTPARKFVTVAGIKYTCTATWFRGKGK